MKKMLSRTMVVFFAMGLAQTAFSWHPPWAYTAHICKEGETHVSRAYRTLEPQCLEGFRTSQRGERTICFLKKNYCVD